MRGLSRSSTTALVDVAPDAIDGPVHLLSAVSAVSAVGAVVGGVELGGLPHERAGSTACSVTTGHEEVACQRSRVARPGR